MSLAFRAGQKDQERSTLARFALDLNGPMEAPNDPMYHRKPETAARKLGGKERIEDSGLCFRRHAATGVGHFQLHVIAGGQRLRDRLRLPDGCVPYGDADNSLVIPNGVRRVGEA